MPRTPIHAILGETTGTLSFELIERACAEAVAERGDLDWKRQLPLTADKSDSKAMEYQQLELAKDIAAMANSGGGMIVYGVAETAGAGTSAAQGVVPIGAVDENTVRDIRRVAGNLVYPPVTALDLIPLAPSGDADSGVLVMLVPDSPDRPHLVHPKNGTDWFGAPYRHGPDTVWMVERQLARAYAARESGRRLRAEEFESGFDDFTASLAETNNLRWVVAFAVPEQPLTSPRELSVTTANTIFERAWRSPIASGWGPRDMTRDEPTKRGLRRFTRSASREISCAAPARARARVEIHGDGTIAAAFTRDGALPGEGYQRTQVPIIDIETTARDFLALLMQVRDDLNVSGDYNARLTVHPPTQIFRRSASGSAGEFVPWDGQRIYGYRPVDATVIGTAGRSELISSWVDVATDAVNQAGAASSLDAYQIETEIWLDD